MYLDIEIGKEQRREILAEMEFDDLLQ